MAFSVNEMMSRLSIIKDKEEDILTQVNILLTNESVDKRWANIGITHLQQAIMAITISVLWERI